MSGQSGGDDNTVVVIRVHTLKAPIVQGALEAEGFDVTLDRPGFGPIYGLHTGAFATAVRVPAEQAERARALIAQIERDLS